MIRPVLRLEEIDKSFGALKVTDHLSLDVLPGETHAVIGPNGAGKTTLIHQISGALAPDAGRIHFDGRDVTTLPMPTRARLGLARSFQIAHVLPRFTALENVALAVQARSGSSFRFWQPAAAEDALNAPAMEALATLGVAERAQTRAGALSHGEKRLLEIAIALADRVSVLVEGRIIATGTPQAVRRDAAVRAAYLGDAA